MSRKEKKNYKQINQLNRAIRNLFNSIDYKVTEKFQS